MITRIALSALSSWTGTQFDAVWHFAVLRDVDQLEKLRSWQRAYLARYGRQDMRAYEDRCVMEFQEDFQALSNLVAQEKGAASSLENG